MHVLLPFKGKTITLQVYPVSLVLTVKDQINESQGIPAEMQILSFNGQELDDMQMLSDYNIQNDSTLQLSFRN